MPRANRYYQTGLVYHITHRCNHQDFLLKNKIDKDRYRYWLFQAVKKYRLSVLNYIVTNNHIHLLVFDTGAQVISNSMRYIASRVAFEHNSRKKILSGAFWQGRYFATAVQTEQYLIHCMAYIDLNMVRCGVIKHPENWLHGGYYEIFNPRKRYCIIDIKRLLTLLNIADKQLFQFEYNQLIDVKLQHKQLLREPSWTENSVIGSDEFINDFNLKRL